MTRNEKRAYWAGIVEEFNNSEFSAREFCQRRELNYQMLLRWRRQFEEKEETQISAFPFTEILPSQKLSLSCASLEISVDYDLPTSALAHVIQALNLASKNS